MCSCLMEKLLHKETKIFKSSIGKKDIQYLGWYQIVRPIAGTQIALFICFLDKIDGYTWCPEKIHEKEHHVGMREFFNFIQP